MDSAASTLKSQVYEQLLKKILDNQFPMDTLLVESQLSAMFSCSRAPVREALIELCRENILRNIPRAGYQIVRISEKEMRDAFQFRVFLELTGLELAFRRLTGENIRELKEIASLSDRVRAEGRSENTLEQKMRINDQFHLRLSELSGNLLMHRTLETTIRLVRRGLAQIMLRENEIPVPYTTYHSGLVQALENQDLEGAKENLKNDILSFESDIWSNLNDRQSV